MQQKLLTELINFGLSEKEARIYLSLIELELATVFEVAKLAGINRSSAYVVLEALKKKGLVGISEDKKVRRYVAASPDILLYTAKAATRNQEEIKIGIESIIPELKALHKSTKRRPVVKVFEGENAAREVYLDTFRSHIEEFRTFSNPVNIFKRVPDLMEKYGVEKNRTGLKMYAISPATKEVLEFRKNIPSPQREEFVLIPEEKFKFSSDMAIYGDKVAFVSPKDNFGIIIESPEIADILKNGFDLALEQAKLLSKKLVRKTN